MIRFALKITHHTKNREDLKTNLKRLLIDVLRRQWHPTPVLLPGKSRGWRSLVGCSPWGREESDTTERLHFHFYALEKEMAAHSSVLAWRIPGTGVPRGLPSMGLHRVGHNWSDLAAAAFTQHRSTLIHKTNTDIKGEIDSNRIIVGDLNTPLTPMDRSSKQEIN